MGWFWGGSNNDDPVKKLDPGLREYLENEAPKKYVPASQGFSTVEEQSQPSKPVSSDQDASSIHAVPSASLFPDGRYADLWKTYKPPVARDQSEMDGVQQMTERRKERGATVHRAAMENCVFEDEALILCRGKGTWTQRSTMCSEENRKFNRCFATQTKFLQALGYASSAVWDDDKEERIQMHADKLYHEMLAYEKRVEEAQAAGQEPPPLTSLFSPHAKTARHTEGGSASLEIPGGEPIPENFKPSKPLDRLTPHERELEIREHYAQIEQEKAYAQDLTPFIKSQEEAQSKRREKAISWFGETMGKWFN